ncbi:hypothetical protein TBR22_A52370 [Luteitalea sp. TBR-22]|uniref:hypothetical protein n=1 Tax=Luteitalea sp. TBR-22 TaxID=2802971 RepID=UPI001AF3BB49|nr:hypothetical protein [Luteitalea sp. TBR-22]BCS36000.1 hypothetical protein TBR22_A52370 [Luteitalea sp. TBR-22]
MMMALRAGIGVCVLGLSTVAHAATPITLPLGSDLALLAGSTPIDLPVPPPPRVPRPDVSQMRLVIKPQPNKGCDEDAQRMRGARAERPRGVARSEERA